MIIQLVWGFLWTYQLFGDVSTWCGIGNVLGLIIKAVLLRIPMGTFAGIVTLLQDVKK